MNILSRGMKSSRDGLDLSARLTRRTATVTMSAPEAACARAISSKLRYLPVPTISRDLNARPAMTSWSDMFVPLQNCRTSESAAQIRGSGSVLDDRTGLGHVRVQGLNDVVVLLFDHATLELHGEGERAVVEREIARKQSKTLDGFELRKMRREALNFRVDQGSREGVRSDFLAAGDGNSLLGGFGGNGLTVGNDQRDHELAAVSEHHGVGNERTGLERIFDRLRRNKFAGRSLEQILLAIGDEQVVVFVEVADVAGVEPTVFIDHFARRFGRFVVTLHHHRSANQDFAVIRRFHLAIRNRLSGAARAIARE